MGSLITRFKCWWYGCNMLYCYSYDEYRVPKNEFSRTIVDGYHSKEMSLKIMERMINPPLMKTSKIIEKYQCDRCGKIETEYKR